MSNRTYGSRPFARLGLATNTAFSSGVPLIIPFSSLEFISDSFGVVAFPGGSFGASPAFACQYGFYFVQLQFALNVQPSETQVTLASSSTTTSDVSVTDLHSGTSVLTMTLNANRLGNEIPYSGTPAGFPTVIFAQANMIGASGLILASGTKLFIQQLTVNQSP